MGTSVEDKERAVNSLIAQGILKSPAVIRAMRMVPREQFLPEEMKEHAYVDTPIPIGYGQTTSALHMTALFCEYGELKLGQNVLEVGGGCGYMSCVYAEVVAPSDKPKEAWGHVWSAEIVKELAECARANVEKTGYEDRVTVIHADASTGLEEHSPYDIIIVTATAPDIPKPLVEQLKPGGILLIPTGNLYFYQELMRVRKQLDGSTRTESLGGVAFVPLRGKEGWRT
jgi:protein-L-isoaspartate(D-aspartate) O-methyltransferase